MKTIGSKQNKPGLARAGIWFTLCNVLQRGIQFLVTPIYTRILLPEGYGRYSTFLTWCNLFAVIATLSLSSGVFNKAMAKYEDKKDEYFSSMLGLSFVSTLITMVIYFCVFPLVKEGMGMTIVQSICMFVCIYFQMVIQLWSARQRYDYKYQGLIVVTVIFSFLIPTLGIGLFYLYFHTEMGIILGYTMANLLVGMVLLLRSIHNKRNLYNNDFWKYALLFNLPLIPHYLSNIVLGQSDRLMIRYYCGDRYTGIYTLAYQVSLVMSIVSNGIENAIIPFIYEHIKKQCYEEIRNKINRIILVSCVPFSGIMLIAPEVVAVLGSSEYREAIYVIPPVVASTYVMFINMFIVCFLFYYERNINVMISTTSGAIVNVLLNMFLIPKMGYLVAAYTTIAGYIVIYVMNLITMYKNLKEIGNKIYNIKTILISILIMTLAVIISIKMYQISGVIRWGLIVIGLVIVLLNRKRIMKLLNH